MIKIDVPEFGKLFLKNIVFDFNGTLAVDGKLISEAATRISLLSESLKIFVITADTFSTVKKELSNFPVTLKVIASERQSKEKRDFIIELGKENTIAVGNGNNDALMLKEAKLGIALLEAEGLSVKTLKNADLLCRNIIEVFELLQNPRKLIATLRA
jgi:P-type E1-E2 ATPase